MIYDGADGAPSLIPMYLPHGNKGNIIITSRNGALMKFTLNCGTEVTQMKDDEARLLLVKAGGFDEKTVDEEHCKEIVSKLHCIPLAVHMAGAYMQATQCSCVQYLELLTTVFKRLLDKKHTEVSDYGHTTYATWELSMQNIQSRVNDKQHPGAQVAIQILDTVAFLHHLDVPLEVFKRAAKSHMVKDTLQPELLPLGLSGHWDQFLFNQGIQELQNFSLIKKDLFEDKLSIHPLVQRWVRDRLSDIDAKQKFEETRFILCCSVDPENRLSDYSMLNDDNTSNDDTYWLALSPHLKANDECGRRNKLQDLKVKAWELNNIGIVFQTAGFHADAEQHFQKALQWSIQLGLDQSEVLTYMHNLAKIYLAHGRHSKVEKLFKELVESNKLKLDYGNPYTPSLMDMLGKFYQHQCRSDKAEKLYKKAVEECKQRLGNDHPHTLVLMNNLASTYQHQGRWNESEKILQVVVESDKLKLGDNHPETLTAMNNLALAYQHQGRLDESEKVLEVVVESSKPKLGPDHPLTLTYMNNLAYTYECKGRWVESERLYKMIIESKKSTLGHDHPDTLTSLNNLAGMYKDQGRGDKVRALLKEHGSSNLSFAELMLL
ncbi:hypothetical protein AMATHDRAFT_69506 [Amanita thiersii Skay4041]|uniref:NB-ARC domain-containing protein n=1 Tax=Amanita thiersii Skay4041 TaxID=703135 RepID=A0A2A9NBB0_9AGAR|nr:hypothetical protein AMATHDRAFT_69506 [Amanita thiersii Skay4041]